MVKQEHYTQLASNRKQKLVRSNKNEGKKKSKIAGLNLLALPGFRARRDIKDFSYPACCAAETSASFSTLILFAFASMASAIASRIFFLCSEVMAYRESLPKLVMQLDLVDIICYYIMGAKSA